MEELTRALLSGEPGLLTNRSWAQLEEVLGVPVSVQAIELTLLGANLQVANEIRFGEWELDLQAAATKAVVNGVALTSVLAARGESSIPATVLSVVVPLVFDLRRVVLSSSDRYIFALLLREAPDRRSIADWYSSLPDEVRDELSELEFRDLIERLEQIDLADSDMFDVVTIDSPSSKRIVRLQLPPLIRR
jgi:hypothetical protein